MVTVKYEDILMAFDFVGSAAPSEHRAYVALETGVVYWVSELNPLDEEVPEDLETSDRYVAIPHKNDLDLGARLALGFARMALQNQYRAVEDIFRHRGAYARFKALLARQGLLEKWYAFQAESTDRALKEWCAENGIELIDTNDESPAAP